MSNNDLAIVILAAGKGTRLKSSLAKVLHRAGGRTLVEQLMRACEPLKARERVVVVGHQAEQVAAVVERLQAPTYSEHLAFTRVPGRDLGNLLPLPKIAAVAEAVIAKVRIVQARIPIPFLLENITYLFEWPDQEMSDAEFITLICRETSAGLLLDIENLYLNASNHGFDPYEFLDALPAELVKEVHLAGGATVTEKVSGRPLLVDSHSHPVPDQALDLLDRVLLRNTPAAIVLERDERLDAVEEILDDVGRIRTRLASQKQAHDQTPPAVRSAG